MKIKTHILSMAIFLSLALPENSLLAATKMFSVCETNYYQSPNNIKLDKAELLFSEIFTRQPDIELIKQFKTMGFDVTYKSLNPFDYTMITESKGHCRGKGNYAINHIIDNQIMVQSPHVLHDKFTGKIAQQIFSSGKIHALALNSVSRKSRDHDKGVGADLAHNDDSFMMRYSLAYARNFKRARIIQLHGFSRKKRKTPSGRLADVIISTGGKRSSSVSKQLYQCLKKQFHNNNILHYPYEVKELGATRNSMVKRFKTIAFTGFIHLEMSYNFRKGLKTEPTKLDKLVQCLVKI